MIGLGALLGMGGCTSEFYRKSADRQVYPLIKDREEKSLGYKPQVAVGGAVTSTVPHRAYEKIPQTPIPPATLPALEPVPLILPGTRLGPPVPEALGGTPKMQRQSPARSGGVDAALMKPSQSLRLGPPALVPPSLHFDLFRSIGYAVQHSRGYQDQMDSVYLAGLNVTLQRHLFEPQPFVTLSEEYNGGQKDAGYPSNLVGGLNAGVNQRLPFGGQITGQVVLKFIDAVRGQVADGQQASMALTTTIPLLRGFGMVNLEPIINGERQLVYQIRAFENYRRTFAVDIASQYFNLRSLQKSVDNRVLSYSNLRTLTTRTEALYAAGRINFLEVQRAQQAELTALTSLISAQQSLETSVDNFKLTLGMPVETPLEIVAVDLEVTVPDLDSQDVVGLAYQYRLDLRTAQDQIDDARRNVQVAQNGLLPDLSLNAAIGGGNRLSTSAGRIGTSASEFDARTLTYSAGVTLSLPIDRLAERNTYRQSLIALDRSQRSYANVHDQVTADVRASERAIRTARLNLEINAGGVKLANARLEYANELLKTSLPGNSLSSRDVVEAQTSLLTAQDAYENARSTLQTQVLRFLLTTGTLRLEPDSGTLAEMMDRTVDHAFEYPAEPPMPPIDRPRRASQ